MVKECGSQDRPALLAYLKQEPVYNTFMLADIVDFGFDEKFQTVYMDIEEEECQGVYLCFYQNLLLYSKNGNINISFLKQLLSEYIPDVVMQDRVQQDLPSGQAVELFLLQHQEITQSDSTRRKEDLLLSPLLQAE